MYYRRPYKAGPIEPLVDPGEYLLIQMSQTFHLYQVALLEPLPRSHTILLNGGVLLATAQVVIPAATIQGVLNMRYGQLGQFRFEVLDDVHVILSQPAALARGLTQNQIARINVWTSLRGEDHMSEHLIFEQDPIPSYTLVNPRGTALAQTRLAFWGFRYILMGEISGRISPSAGGKLPAIKTFSTPDEAKRAGYNFTVVNAAGWQ